MGLTRCGLMKHSDDSKSVSWTDQIALKITFESQSILWFLKVVSQSYHNRAELRCMMCTRPYLPSSRFLFAEHQAHTCWAIPPVDSSSLSLFFSNVLFFWKFILIFTKFYFSLHQCLMSFFRCALLYFLPEFFITNHLPSSFYLPFNYLNLFFVYLPSSLFPSPFSFLLFCLISWSTT